MRNIEAIEPNGRLHQFPSVRAAERAGYIRQNIHACLSGRLKRHRGLYWRYASGVDPPGIRSWTDGLHRLPAFIDERCTTEDTERPIVLSYLVEQFRRWLPAGEDVDEGEALAWLGERYPVDLWVVGLWWK